MGFFDLFKKKNKEDDLDKQIAEARAKNAELEAQRRAELGSEDQEVADDAEATLALSKVAASSMDALTAMLSNSGNAPSASRGKISFNVGTNTASVTSTTYYRNLPDGTRVPISEAEFKAEKARQNGSPEAEAAYQVALDADNANEGEWNDEIFELYKQAADLGSPIACELVGEYCNGNYCDYDAALFYLKKAAEFGRNVYYSIGSIYDIQFEDADQADAWYQRGVDEAGCRACAEELENHSLR